MPRNKGIAHQRPREFPQAAGFSAATLTLSNQVFSDVADALEGAGHQDARGGMFGSRFERHVGLSLR